MGCKYRGYVGCTLDSPTEQFEWVMIDDDMRELVCKKYQPDSDDGEYLYFDDEWNAPEIKQ